MPELPEVETVRRFLEERACGVHIERLCVLFPGCIAGLAPDEFARRLRGRRIGGWRRLGKYLIAELDDGSRFSLHLRMTGRLRCVPDERSAQGPHTRLIITFKEGGALQFDDPRKFGRLRWYHDEEALSSSLRLGPDPLSASFGPEALQAAAAGRKRPVKSLLLDQSLVAGVGNIYADEALFAAGIRPERASQSLSPAEVRALWQSLRRVLQEGIEHGGTSFRDYVGGDGRPGRFQERLKVYGRKGMPCTVCQQTLAAVRIGGRTSVFCPACQR